MSKVLGIVKKDTKVYNGDIGGEASWQVNFNRIDKVMRLAIDLIVGM